MKGKSRGGYFVYAIGEIALVVIGILVALWINNWSEGQKLKKVEIDILEGIKSDLAQDTVDMNFNIRAHRVSARVDSILLNLLVNRAPNNQQLVNMVFGTMSGDLIINLRRAYFEEAKSKGLAIISNKELREEVNQLYEFSYTFLTDAENSLALFDHHSLMNDALKGYLGSDGTKVTLSDANYRRLLNDENARFTLLRGSSIERQILVGVYEPIKLKVLALIEAIDTELQALK